MTEFSTVRHVTSKGMHVIQLGFFNVLDETSCLSGVVSWWTGGKYGHVELRFSDGYVTSITENPGKVHYEKRVLSNENYRCFFNVAVSPKHEAAMQRAAQLCAQNEIPFSKFAMIWNFLPIVSSCFPMRATGSNFFFCSQYITRLLQTAELFPDLDPDVTSPNDLYRVLLDATQRGAASVGMNRELFNQITRG
jgi:hypothetical protein